MSKVTFSPDAWVTLLASPGAYDRAVALAGLFAGGGTVEFLSATNALIRTITFGPWTVSTPTPSNYYAVPGDYVDPGTGSGTPAAAVFKVGGAEVMRCTCGVGTGFYSLWAPIVAGVLVNRGPFAVGVRDPDANQGEPPGEIDPLVFATPETVALALSGTLDLERYVSGGQPPYKNYTLKTGALPAGVSLAGSVLSATSGAALGTVSGLSFEVEDSAGDPLPSVKPTNVTKPEITGSAKVGEVLTCDDGEWAGSPTSITRQWVNDAGPIANATGPTYLQVAEDETFFIECVVVAHNAAGDSDPVSSNKAGPVLPAPAQQVAPAWVDPPVVSGNDVAGSVLVCSPGTVTGTPTPTRSYRLLRGGAQISTGPTWIATEGTPVTWEVTADNGVGSPAVITTDPFGPIVAAPVIEPGALPQFAMTSEVGGADLPFAFGHAFAQGDVPAGSRITMSGTTAFESEVRNTWADGSVKFAAIKGRANFSPGVKKSFQIGTTTSADAGAFVPAVTAAEIGITTVTHETCGTVSLADAIQGVDLTSFAGTAGVAPTQPGRTRVIPGRTMTESHFFAPFPGANQLYCFWHVRKWSSGRIRVRTVVGNGYTRVGTVVQQNGLVTVRVNGVQTFSNIIYHGYRNRWRRDDWIGGDPKITPHHDGAYLIKTKLVENYVMAAPSGATLDGLMQEVEPCTRGPFRVGSASPGAAIHIGMLPRHEVFYITSNGDARAFRALMVSEQGVNALNNYNVAGSFWLDEKTLLPINLWEFRNYSVGNLRNPSGGGGAIYGGQKITPAAKTWDTDIAHGTSGGFLAYLVTAEYFSMETAQGMAGSDKLSWGINGSRALEDSWAPWVRIQPRGMGWGMRAMMEGYIVTPENRPEYASFRADYKTYVEESIRIYHKLTKPYTNPIGFPVQIDDSAYAAKKYDAAGKTVLYLRGCAKFQMAHALNGIAQCYVSAGHMVSEERRAQWLECITSIARLFVGWGGSYPADMTYRYWTSYQFATRYQDSSGVWQYFDSFGAMQDAQMNIPEEWRAIDSYSRDMVMDPLSSYADGLSIVSSSLSIRGPQQIVPLSLSVDLGVPGAAAAYARVTGASNWQSGAASVFAREPEFGVKPRSL